MYTIAKRYTNEGRDRYGSAIFVDDLSEEIIDSLTGRQRDQNILVVLGILLVSKVISANLLGLVITLPIYCLIYFLTEKNKKLTFTQHRMLITTSYQHPRLVLTAGYTLLISSVVIGIRTILPQVLDGDSFRVFGMVAFLQGIGVPDILLFQYQQFYLKFALIFNYLDASITIATNLWFGTQYVSLSFKFSEINLSHVGEELITDTRWIGLLDFGVILLLYITIERFLIPGYSILLLFLSFLVYYYFPKWNATSLNFFGPTSRALTGEIIITEEQSGQLSRITAAIFGWDTPNQDQTRSFPDSIIPSEVASTYQTGMGASLKNALLQANQLGALVSALVNIFVVIVLTRFAIRYAPSSLDTVFILGTGLVLVSLVFGALIHYLNKIRIRLQNQEKLMIGSGFIARYVAPSLWIVKGSKMEGTKLGRGVSQPYIKLDRSRGLIIQWQKLTFLFIALTIILVVAIWSALGAVEISNLVLLFPFLLDFGLQFLVEKATLELGFFIILGYILWFLIQFLYPQFYARSRPSLLIELEYSTLSPIILKDFDEHQDASIEFTKAVIKSSRSHRRGTTGRPGEFYLKLQLLKNTLNNWTKLIFHLGEKGIIKEIESPVDLPYQLSGYLRESALKGYPIVTGKVDIHTKRDVITKYFSTELLYEQHKNVTIPLDDSGEIVLGIEIIDQKL